MDYKERWEIIEKLGSGGQGKVSRVRNKLKTLGVQSEILTAFRNLRGPVTGPRGLLNIELLCKGINDRMKLEDPSNQGALKVLHKPEKARDFDLARKRIKREIQTMSESDHPNLLKIIDHDDQSEWFVSEYHPNGSLTKHPNMFKGNLHKTLKALRPLITGVAYLHKKEQTHRDIKPQNIFIDVNGNLILGDFGLIYFEDKQQKRLSKTLSNVGSHEWMAPWAYLHRVEDVEPTLDIFPLGKVIWSMVSGMPALPFWYHFKQDYNLIELFPDSSEMKFANSLFKKCIVQEKSDCIADIQEFLDEIGDIITKIETKADIISPEIERLCKVCGIGYYKLIVDRDRDTTVHFGLVPQKIDRSFKIFTCDHCGHVQLFAFGDGESPVAWQE